jgi:hypothetical protein
VKQFEVKEAEDKVSALAKFLISTYDGLISVSREEIELHANRRTLAKRNPERDLRWLAEHVDEEIPAASAFADERDQRRNDLGIPLDRTLVLLVDLERVDEKGKAGLSITKAQKQALLEFANKRFSEFSDGTPTEKWTEPARIAHTYVEYFDGRKCIDE